MKKEDAEKIKKHFDDGLTIIEELEWGEITMQKVWVLERNDFAAEFPIIQSNRSGVSDDFTNPNIGMLAYNSEHLERRILEEADEKKIKVKDKEGKPINDWKL